MALTDVDNKSMNGMTEMVVDSSILGGRITVRLHEGKTVRIKYENLEVVADILD